MEIALQTTLCLFFICGASFFAGSETGFVSWNPLKIGHRAVSGDIVARWALFLIKHKDRLLSAQLIGNNICVIGASLTFASLFKTIDSSVSWNLSRIPSPESWLLTPVIVLFGEMLPKSLFRIYPFLLTMNSVPLLMVVYFATLPFTFVFSVVTGMFWKNAPHRGESFMSKVREEMVLVALEGSKTGTLFKSADIFIQNVLALNEKKVGDMINTRDSTLNGIRFYAHECIGEVKKRIPDQPGIIVYTAGEADIAGYISLFDLIQAPEEATLGSCCKPLPRFGTEQTMFSALRSADEESHFFIITDQSGSLTGIIDRMMLLKAAFKNPVKKR
ncbi:MAG: DUF21 domain-containing protein [Chitinispirillaceae bacterium]|nr:DUF21 domain-containing protein [Chitinispirillaceae bacterium]